MFKTIFLIFLVAKLSCSLVREKFEAVRARYSTNILDWFKTSNITYSFFEEFEQSEKVYIRDQLSQLSSRTCLKFTEIPTTVCNNFFDPMRDHLRCIRFYRTQEPQGCEAIPGNNQILLAPHCFEGGWILHEIIHLMGFRHEHQRADRDCFVEVGPLLQNDHNFKKIPKLDITFPYDFESVMHYRRGKHFRPAAMYGNDDQVFGSKDILSEIDVATLNYMYCGGPHYRDINPTRYHEFYCWVNCHNCSTENIVDVAS